MLWLWNKDSFLFSFFTESTGFFSFCVGFFVCVFLSPSLRQRLFHSPLCHEEITNHMLTPCLLSMAVIWKPADYKSTFKAHLLKMMTTKDVAQWLATVFQSCTHSLPTHRSPWPFPGRGVGGGGREKGGEGWEVTVSPSM